MDSGAQNKTADCLLHLVELPEDKPVPINMVYVTNTDGPAFNTRNKTDQHLSPDASTSQPDIKPEISEATDP